MTIPPKSCTDRFGAVLLGRNFKTYVFNHDKVYELGMNSLGVEQGPYDIASKWKGMKFVDAVHRRVNHRDNYISFLHGDRYGSDKLFYD